MLKKPEAPVEEESKGEKIPVETILNNFTTGSEIYVTETSSSSLGKRRRSQSSIAYVEKLNQILGMFSPYMLPDGQISSKLGEEYITLLSSICLYSPSGSKPNKLDVQATVDSELGRLVRPNTAVGQYIVAVLLIFTGEKLPKRKKAEKVVSESQEDLAKCLYVFVLLLERHLLTGSYGLQETEGLKDRMHQASSVLKSLNELKVLFKDMNESNRTRPLVEVFKTKYSIVWFGLGTLLGKTSTTVSTVQEYSRSAFKLLRRHFNKVVLSDVPLQKQVELPDDIFLAKDESSTEPHAEFCFIRREQMLSVESVNQVVKIITGDHSKRRPCASKVVRKKQRMTVPGDLKAISNVEEKRPPVILKPNSSLTKSTKVTKLTKFTKLTKQEMRLLQPALKEVNEKSRRFSGQLSTVLDMLKKISAAVDKM